MENSVDEFEKSLHKFVAGGQAAQRAADDGMQRASAHADRVCNQWTMMAFGFLKGFAQMNEFFMTEHVRLNSELRELPQPPDNRAWGTVVTMAVKAGWIAKSHYAPSATGHMRPCVVWRSRLFKK